MNNLEKIKKYRKIRNKTIFSGCVHKDDSCNGISKAHSLQENGILNKLARNKMVLAIDFSKVIADKGKVILHEVSISKASTFTGLCNHHDNKIFKPIEDHFEYKLGDTEQNFLFAYRAFALGYYERHSSYQLYFAQLEEALKDSKSPLYINRLYHDYENYGEHLEFIESIRIKMNNNLDNRRFDRVSTDTLVWPGEYGIASTSMFFLERDTLGRIINAPDSYMSPLFFTIFPHNGFTYILLSYFSKDKWKYDFIKNQIVTVPIDKQKVIISNLISSYIENIHIAPEFWDGLPIGVRNRFYEIFNYSIGKKKPSKLDYYNNFNLFES